MAKQSSNNRKIQEKIPPEVMPSERAKNEANLNDKIIKENLKPLVRVLLRKVLGLTFDSLEFLAVTKQQTTLEREPDFIVILKNSSFPSGILLHIEFETEADAEMAERVHEYLAIERRRHKMDVLPFVVYLGPGKPDIPCELHQIGLDFKFPVFYLSQHPFEDFLNGTTMEEVTTAILCDFQDVAPEIAVRMIVSKLQQLKSNRHNLNKFLVQLRTLSKLRKLQPLTKSIIEEMALKNFFTIEDDIVYVEAHEIGLQKGFQKGIEKGLEEGIQTGLEKGKIEGEDLKEHIAAFNMLDKSFELDLIGGILEIPNAKVEAIKKLWELDQKIKELAAAERKTIAQAAKILKVKRDVFAKLKEIEADRKKR